ncbi:MAG: DegQ family serine endoprotease [Holophaga sp.]|nr:DegQ family serine endoprotease [Holophaga sp.]
MKRFIVYTASALAVPLLVGGGMLAVTGLCSSPKVVPPPPALTASVVAPAKALGDAYAAVAAHVKPAVVSVYSEKIVRYQSPESGFPFGDDFFRQFFGNQAPPQRRQAPKEYKVPQRGMGSGMILDKAGHILTNYHVVKDVDEIKVRLSDKREFKAVVVSSDPKTDVAVIRIKDKVPADLPTVQLGNSDALRVGDVVMAVGAPFGLTQTVTTGIISAMGRSEVGLADYEDFLQTDAPINPGNSGGPLVNMDGQVIGMNSAIATNSGQSAGIGFAIPSNMINSMLPTLTKGGKIARGLLGVGIQDLDKDLAKQFKLPDSNGALVTTVSPDSAAEKAGIQVGDVIIGLNGKAVDSSRELRNRIGSLAPGAKVKVELNRGGKTMSVTATIGEAAAEAAASEEGAESSPEQASKLGLSLQPLTPELAQRFGLTEKSGLVIADVDQGSPAAQAGLQEGDLIVEVNRKRVSKLSELQKAVADSKKEGSVLLLVKRKTASLFVALPLN